MRFLCFWCCVYWALFLCFIAEAAKEKSGGLAYEVILKPASADNVPRPQSPPKERPISQEVIEKKLKEAEERRLVSFSVLRIYL